MVIPTQFLPINTNKPKPVKRGTIQLDKSESHSDSAHQATHSRVVMYDKREGEDRRKRKIKPLLDTRSGRDRRYDEKNPSIDIKA
jgi:hypothetical protein